MTDTELQLDQLDALANDAFAGRVVRKDLVRQVTVGANVPVYVLEFLLGKYCASDDPSSIEAGLTVVNQTLKDNFIRPDESELAKARAKQTGEFRLIDKVDERLLASEDKFWAHLQNFNDRFVHIPENLVYKYDRLLQGGAWCQIDLVYNAADDEAQKRPFYIRGLKPIQVAAFDLEEFVDGRRGFSRDAWLDLVMRTIGLEPERFDLRGKLLAVCRLIPMAERNFNLIELGPWGTGKSFVYREAKLFTSHFGFVSDYFAEALRQVRKQSFVRAIDAEFALGPHLSARDEKAVRKAVSGLLKIIHPHGEWTLAELREYLEFALEGRRRVKEQLKKLAAHDYAKTAFSYIEHPSGTICRIDVVADNGPSFVRRKKDEAELYMRLNNSTRLLNTAEALDYVQTRWRT